MDEHIKFYYIKQKGSSGWRIKAKNLKWLNWMMNFDPIFSIRLLTKYKLILNFNIYIYETEFLHI